MAAKIITADISSVLLPKEGNLRRLPLAPNRYRPQKFWDEYEDRVLVYDIFWHADAKQVLLVCPPAVNLGEHWHGASFVALPSGKPVKAQFHSIRASMTIALKDVPPGSTKLKIDFAGDEFVANISPNLSDEFAGRRIIFTMSQNNPLKWIDEWARFHQVMHNADSVIIFDNGSSIYEANDVAKCLGVIQGIKKILLLPIPHNYGPHDPGVVFNRFWANFLQVASFSILLRRFGASAAGLLNVDIDELVAPVPDGNIFELAQNSKDGFCSLNGKWVESIVEENAPNAQPSHTDFRTAIRDFRAELNAKKWVLDPSRQWLENLDIHPSPHRIKNMPKPMASKAPSHRFFHFKGINNNWKEDRNRDQKANRLIHHRPEQLSKMISQFLKKSNETR